MLLTRLKRTFSSTFHRFEESARSGHNSFVNLGRKYEEKCGNVLSEIFKVPIKIVGGANDGGIDLIWSKSISNSSIEFVGQCKLKEFNRVAPEVCRALDGVLSKRSSGTVGCLISNIRPSKKSLEYMDTSSFPLLFFKISDCSNCNYVKEIFVNDKFTKLYPSIQSIFIRHSTQPRSILKFP